MTRLSGPAPRRRVRWDLILSVWLMCEVAIAVVVTVLALASCGGRVRPGAPAPSDPLPIISPPVLVVPSDRRVPLSSVPWCGDPEGHSTAYPCKWDNRERPAPDWDPQAAPVAIFVTRTQGCALARVIKVSPDDNVSYGCYYPPGS